MDVSTVESAVESAVTSDQESAAPVAPEAKPASKVMQIRKRNDSFEDVDLNKIFKAVSREAEGLSFVDALHVSTKTIGGIFNGATTEQLDKLSIDTAAMLIAEEPEYAELASRLLSSFIRKEVENQGIHSFSQSIEVGANLGLINDRTAKFVAKNARKLNNAIDHERNKLFKYFGMNTVYDRYLQKHPTTRKVIESPQYWLMRVACGMFSDQDDMASSLELYRRMSNFDYLTSTPTLFNSGCTHEQLSSCFLLDSPEDNLRAIYEKVTDVALLSKFSGGIGLGFSRIRSRGSLIRGTNGLSQGIIPFAKVFDSSVGAVNQGGRRKGAACLYLETWHADFYEWIELKDNTGDEARRARNLNLANWVPDLFMKRVNSDAKWTFFDPKDVPDFVDLYGEEFEVAYAAAEQAGLGKKSVSARDVYQVMMKTLAETGNGWMCFKDSSNKKSNQTGKPGNVIHLSNLCTEILEVTKHGDETAVCNLGSINLGNFVLDGAFDYEKLAVTVGTAIRQLDSVIDKNYYAIDSAKKSNSKWRPIGLGIMGLQDVFFKLRMPFDSEEALKLSTKISEEIYYHALLADVDLAERLGAHENFSETRAAQGVLQFDLWDNVQITNPSRWEALRARIVKNGLRNSLMIAIAPTATIASIVGSYECHEPQVSNLFKRETLSGEFLQVNPYLISDLKKLGLWNDSIRNQIRENNGSIQNINEIPDEIALLYRTVWEVPAKALLRLAAARSPFIDQSQSLNLFMESPTIPKLSKMYMRAWEMGLKTTYYLRSRPASTIMKTRGPAVAEKFNQAVSEIVDGPVVSAEDLTPEEALACSLENPESCVACQ